jgi:hypothetical protein
MRLKTGIDYPLFLKFLKEVKRCKGDVFYKTSEGDRFNLKSILSFAAYALAERATGLVECVDETDIGTLSEFLEDA